MGKELEHIASTLRAIADDIESEQSCLISYNVDLDVRHDEPTTAFIEIDTYVIGDTYIEEVLLHGEG